MHVGLGGSSMLDPSLPGFWAEAARLIGGSTDGPMPIYRHQSDTEPTDPLPPPPKKNKSLSAGVLPFRVVVQDDVAEFADAAFQAMFLGDGNGITSILSRVRAC
jgi:hypothetical protein